MKKINSVKRTAFFLLLFTVGFSCSRELGQSKENGFFSWDSNEDRRVDGDEFNSAFQENDFYDLWDSNSDGMLDEKEWSEGVLAYYSGREFGDDFRVWDLNQDKYVDSEEYTQKTFELWDENDDGYIDSEEYVAWVAEDSEEDN